MSIRSSTQAQKTASVACVFFVIFGLRISELDFDSAFSVLSYAIVVVSKAHTGM